MSPETSDLLKRALALPADERAALANTLLDTLESPNESIIKEDPPDNRILECAVEDKSAYIVTRDNDLLRLGSHGDIR